jgi:anion-transporting  ArsA/GET3 family ATPase
MDIAGFCTQSPVIIVAGKGGVGKTTVSAALARTAARSGLSVLIVELEGKSGLTSALGHPELLTYDEFVLSADSAEAPDGRPMGEIRARTLTPDDALLEYLVDHGLRRVSKRLVNSGALDVVATAVPGIRDILVLGKVKQLERARRADLIVVDAPAAGHAITFLTSAQGLLDSARVGPIRTQAADVVELLSDATRCQVVLVTLAEETPVNETVETAFKLEDRVGTALGPVIVNGVYPHLDHLEADPLEAAALAGVTLGPGEAEALGAAAEFRRRREEVQAEQVGRLADALPLPQLWLPNLFTTDIGLAEIDQLADALAIGLESLPEVAAGPGGRPENTSGPGGRPENTSGPGGRPENTAGPGGRPENTAGPGGRPENTAGPGRPASAESAS